MKARTTREESEMRAKDENEYSLPPGHEDASRGFARAFVHAKEHGNPDKAALLFAERFAEDFEYELGDEENA
jgi:hypothetical protein